MRSATSRMRLSCVTIRIVAPCSRASACIRSTTSRPETLSSDAVGSSASTMAGLPASARAIATRWRWPPDIALGRLSACAPSPTASSIPSARRRSSARTCRPPARSPSSTFSAAVSAPSRLCCWKMKPIRRRTSSRRAPSAPFSSWPSTRTLPDCAERSAPTSVKSVVLPDPDGPVTMMISPAGIVADTSNRICRRSAPLP